MTPAKRKATACEVLVVGAGPTGLVLANELARHGVSFRIIDKAKAPSEKSKALGIQVRSLEMFEDMGVIEPVLKEGLKVSAANFFMEGKQIAQVTFASLDSPYPHPIMLPQDQTEKILIEALDQKGITIEREKELIGLEQDAQKVTAQIRGVGGKIETLKVPWLVGCDGAHSQVRHSLDLPFHGAEYPETFVLADVHVDWDLPSDCIHIFFKHDGLMASFPMKEKGRIRLMGVRRHPEAHLQGDPDLPEMQEMLDQVGPGRGKLHDPKWLAKFTLHRRGVPRYQVGRAFVAGDAAHIHSPVGGQGMNTGMQDAYNLGWKLGLVTKNKVSDEFIQSYNLERQPVGHKVLTTTDRMFEAMISENSVIKFLRNHVLPAVLPSISDFAGNKLAHTMSELDINYRGSPIVSEQTGGKEMHLHSGPRAGDRAPDVQFSGHGKGKGPSLFETLKIPQHALLIFQGTQRRVEPEDPWISFKKLLESHYPKLVIPFGIYCGQSKKVFKSGQELNDQDLSAHQKYGVEGEGAVYLIRPDGYVAYRSRGLHADDLGEFLRKYFK